MDSPVVGFVVIYLDFVSIHILVENAEFHEKVREAASAQLPQRFDRAAKDEIKAGPDQRPFHSSGCHQEAHGNACVEHADGGLTVPALFSCHSLRSVMGEDRVLPQHRAAQVSASG